MFRTYDEIFEFIDPENKIYTWFEREANLVVKHLDGFFEFLGGFIPKDFNKPSLSPPDPNPIWLRANKGEFCQICLISMQEEQTFEAKGKSGHARCLNFWLNRVMKED